MPYASKEYYEKDFKGPKELSGEEIEQYLQLASEKIDEITFNRIVGNFDKLTNFQKKKIQEATCYQANYFNTNGTESVDLSSYSLLDMSITLKDNKSKTVAEKNNMSEKAYRLVKETGLTTRIFI